MFAGKSIGQIADHFETIGGLDHTVSWSIVNASYKQQDNPGVTEATPGS